MLGKSVLFTEDFDRGPSAHEVRSQKLRYVKLTDLPGPRGIMYVPTYLPHAVESQQTTVVFLLIFTLPPEYSVWENQKDLGPFVSQILSTLVEAARNHCPEISKLRELKGIARHVVKTQFMPV